MGTLNYFGKAATDAPAAGARVRRDADTVERELADEQQREHMAAEIRGERIKAIARRVAFELHAKGRLGTLPHPELERELVGVLAEIMYPGRSVDL